MERLLREASPLGLYAEELDADTGRHLGNFPQAFSHLALIEAAARIILAERIEELRVMSHYDVIVIGSGAGGGTLVHRLAPSGKRVLLLERGDWLPREPQNWSAADVFVDNRYVSRGHLVRRATASRSSRRCTTSSAARRSSTAPRCTGCARRTSASSPTTTASRPRGRSPTTSSSRTTCRPSSSTRSTARAARTRPSRPPARPYPFPAVSHEPRIQQLSDDLAAAGLHPFHAPCGVMLDEGDMPHSACVRCATCDGFPCLVHAKSDAEVLAVRPALEHDNVTLRTRTRALRLETNAAGTAVTGVVVERDGARETLTADIVVVSCGAANSAALLLASATDAHPHGLANGSGQVGRNYMFHNSQAVLALSKEENPTVFQKTLGINDFYFADRRTSSSRWATSRWSGSPRRTCTAARSRCRRSSRRAGRCDDVARHAVDFWLSTEDLPRPSNRVTLPHDGSIALSYTPTNQVPKQRLLHELKSMLGRPRDARAPPDPAPRVPQERDPGGGRRAPGRARAGSARDPATSVLNTDCRAHEVDNLYVVDTSFFPSIGAVNPALTAMANALRVGDHLLERLGAARAGGRRCRLSGGRSRSSAAASAALAAAQALRKRQRRRDARRPDEPSPLPAAALPGRRRRCCRWASARRRSAAMLRSQSNVRVAMAEVTERRRRAARADARPRRDGRLRQPDRRVRRRHLLLRARRVAGHLVALKTLADAVALRERIFSAFEEAERAPDGSAAQRRG